MKNEFVIAKVYPGKLNAMVKILMKQMDINDASEAVRRVSSGEWVVSEVKKQLLLKLMGTVTVSAQIKRFIAKDNFVINTDENASVKISFLGENFKKWFSPKTEQPIEETAFKYQQLIKYSVDTPIISELGGESKAETTLQEMFVLMREQGNGEDGHLLTRGYANIFYICDCGGVLRAVRCGWLGDGWNVLAYSVDAPNVWHDGFRVFSRSSLES